MTIHDHTFSGVTNKEGLRKTQRTERILLNIAQEEYSKLRWDKVHEILEGMVM